MTTLRRTLSVVTTLGIAGAGAIAFSVVPAESAQAFTGKCATTVPAAKLVADGVCEVRITTAGDSTFTPPTGITKLAAVLVGGGGGGGTGRNSFLYAGSGGAVTYVDSVPLTGPISVTVGAAGSTVDYTDVPLAGGGGDTTVGTSTAAGGAAAVTGSDYCNLNDTFYRDGDGNGGANPAVNQDASCTPGAGVTISSLSGLDATLFPASSLGTDVFGGGGTASTATTALTTAGSGASIQQALDGTAVDTDGTPTVDPALPGLVIFRFAAAPVLAETGSEVPWQVPAISVALVALGVLLRSIRRRETRTSR